MRVLLTGASGGLGAYVLESLIARSAEVIGWSGRVKEKRAGMPLNPIDLTDEATLRKRLDEANADVILHLAAISSAEEVRQDQTRAFRINVEATETIAQWCLSHDRRLIFASTDMVFDGTRSWNKEDDLAAPISAYGRMKLEAEECVRKCPRGLSARTALLYGEAKSGRSTFFDQAVKDLKLGKPRAFFDDEYRTPLTLRDAADIFARLTELEIRGTLHIAGSERVSRYELLRRASIALGLDAELVQPNRRNQIPSIEPRPADLSLDTTKLAALLPNLRRRSIEESFLEGPFALGKEGIQ